jgi:drug/metabolite transporter (DMT)-like permease
MIAVLGGAGAALAWALSTLCSSRSSRLIDPACVVAGMMLVGLTITAPLALASGLPSHVAGTTWMWLFVAGAGNVFGLVLVYQAMRIGKVALIAPLASTEGAIAALIALAAGESVAPAVGMALAVIAGGVVMSATPGPEALRAVHVRSVSLALLAACLFGASLYATARAGSRVPSAWVVLSARLIGSIALAAPLVLSRRLHFTRRALPFVVVAGVCEVVGFYSYVAGARHGIAVAAVLASQFAALAAVAAYLLFRERLARIQVLGVCTVIAGVAVLSALRA